MPFHARIIPAIPSGYFARRSLNFGFLLILILAMMGGFSEAFAVPFNIAGPGEAQTEHFESRGLDRIDALVEAAVQEGKLPGAVVLVGRNEDIIYRKAFGHRTVLPSKEPMTMDTMFDLASLTKVVATTTSIMLLAEDGRVSLDAPVADYIPGFERHGKSKITPRHLLTHMSGLRPGIDPDRHWSGYDAAIAQVVDDVPLTKPGERLVYSDLNFILLGEIVRRVSGMPLDEFARVHVFDPLGMGDTMFSPAVKLRLRIAPTEVCWSRVRPCPGPVGVILRGTVHDPTARKMGGVSGHAGLFSTADDLALFCRMLLGGGALGETRILSPATVATMILPATPPDDEHVRGLGWSLDWFYAEIRDKHLPTLPFDHSGFTGTYLWLDPVSGIFVVFLSNRLHPDSTGDVKDLREQIAAVAASVQEYQTDFMGPPAEKSRPDHRERDSLPGESSTHRASVLTGIDVLQAEGFARLRGRRVGLLTNHTGRDRTGASTIDLLHKANAVKLAALFSPEHGIRGSLNEPVPSSRDDKTGLVIHSLYGKYLRPTRKMLAGIDTMVIDLQGIGARFYTYMTTMAYVMEEAAKRNIAVVVLDRPNPINGLQIEGPALDRSLLGFTGYFPMPIRHGMTMGELAQLFKGENVIAVDLDIVKMRGWRRGDWFDHTGLPWLNPSPNIRNLIQATLYPGIGAIEGTNISVGRGTDRPFEQIGAPWIDGVELAAKLNARLLAGVRFYPVSFTPESSRYTGEACQGVFILLTDRLALRPVRLGLEIAAMLHRLYPDDYRIEAEKHLMGSKEMLALIKTGMDPAKAAANWVADELLWRRLRARYLLY